MIIKKIHYTIYNGNYEKGQGTCPMYNDQKQYPYQYLTTDIDEVTCKRCLKSKIKSANFALEMTPLMLNTICNTEELINRLKKEKEMTEERLKYLEPYI